MRSYLVLSIFIILSSPAFGQGCFEKCRDHLNTLPGPNEDFEARIARSEKVLQNLVGCQAPNFDVVTVTGERLSLKSLKGKVVVVNFWFQACVPCVEEMPALNKLVSEYKNKDVVFIAFSRDNQNQIQNFLKGKEFNYKIVSREHDMTETFCVIAGWPMNMVIDKKGKVQFIKAGGTVDESASSYAYGLMKPIIEKCLND